MNKDDNHVLRDLGNGLVLRQATAQDVDALTAFNILVHKDDGVGAIVRDLTSAVHPTMQASDFTVVADTQTGAIVSSLCLIPQVWTYAGIPFGVGQVELVGTHPDYRNRGLMRAQMEVAHQWSLERGDAAQMITGIPFYYRQFGYEMCLNLQGWRASDTANIPKLAEGQAEPYRVRPAVESDLALITHLYEAGCKRSLVACIRDAARWQYELTGASEKNLERRALRIIEDETGKAVGFLAHRPYIDNATMLAIACELVEGVSWRAVTPSVLRYLHATGTALSAGQSDGCKLAGFELGEAHPVYEAFPQGLAVQHRPYSWYVRVPDIGGFLQRIKPVLERRLAASVVAGHSGELKIGFYTHGLRVAFNHGAIEAIEPWSPAPDSRPDSWGNISFPGLTFLQMVFGYRNFNELYHAFPDCYGSEEAQVLLNVLFPKQPSHVWSVT